MTSGRPTAASPGGLRSDLLQSSDEWDRLVDAAVGGDFRQSSAWAQAKQLLGWEAARVVIRDGDTTLAGAQLLIRRAGPRASIGFGYVPRGPWLTSAGDDRAAGAAVGALLRQIRRSGVRLMCLAPPDVTIAWEPLLRARGFLPTHVMAAPRFSTIVDLSRSDDALLAGMHQKTRYNVRLAERRGVVVRVGGIDEVGTFYALYQQASARLSFFNTESLAHFQTLCRSLDERGRVRLVFAEVDGRPVSAMVLILFGGVATYFRAAWSAEHADRHPNEAMHFAAMRIARAAGCRFYDFEDITPEAARALREHGRVDRSVDALSAFKLSFGGDVVEFPAPYIYARGAVARTAYRLASSRAGRATAASALLRVRNVGGG